ncbi:hypothetical protein, partial [Streptomyces sp. NPDC047976]|uniref:hypothetical protein n=1 Tax=Streptomyces sp. NPDC047976 TaxID=3155746 RepID=UPI003424D3C3
PPEWTGYQLLALIFGTLLSSQGTDASFVLTLSGFPPGFRSSFLRFRLYQTLSCPISSVLSGPALSRFSLRRGHYVNAFPCRLIIEPIGREFGHAEYDPARGES